MKKTFIIIAILLASIAPASAQTTDYSFLLPDSIDFGVESYIWQEFSSEGGALLLTEQGFRPRLGILYGDLLDEKKSWHSQLGFSFYDGDVNYDGQDQAGVPVASNTAYTGVLVSLLVAKRRPLILEHYDVDYFATVIFEYWRRSIDSSVNALGLSVNGITEEYLSRQGRIGLGFRRSHLGWTGYFKIGFSFPYSVDEKALLSELGYPEDVSLKPKGKLSGFITYTASFTHVLPAYLNGMFVTLSYERHRFDQSDVVSIIDPNGATVGVLQPKSEFELVGIRLGRRF